MALATARRRPFRVTVGAERWTVRRVKRLTGDDGARELGNTVYETKTILIADHLPGEDLADTAAHEALHAALPDLSEAAVERAAGAVCAALRGFYGKGLP